MPLNRTKELLLSQDELKRLLHYDAATGVFTRRVRTSYAIRVGDVAGCDNGEGYRNIRIHGRFYVAHRLAWLYVHGEWPIGWIDHIDGNRDNNRIVNLRCVTASENMQNQRGRRGTGRNGSGWSARISLNRKKYHLGTFPTEAEAHAVYLEAKKVMHPTAPERCFVNPRVEITIERQFVDMTP